MKLVFPLIAAVAALPAAAEDTRQLDAHEHGVSALDIALDGQTLALAFEAPGADIVGFEYAATSDADRAAIAGALETLSAPLSLFALPEAAGCRVVEAQTALLGDDGHDHDDHGHDDHDHDHEDHADHDDHAGHDDHDDHADHADHDDHKDHGDHTEGDGHTAFQATYTLDCDDTGAIDRITFAYFDLFPNALAVEVRMLTGAGAQAAEVTRDAPVLQWEQ